MPSFLKRIITSSRNFLKNSLLAPVSQTAGASFEMPAAYVENIFLSMTDKFTVSFAPKINTIHDFSPREKKAVDG
jgi:hypothetical protein